jgi:hypothetical protein
LTLAEERSLSPATAVPLVAMPSLAVRAAFIPTLSAATAVAERNAAFRRADALALAVEAVFTAAVEAAFTAAGDATERPQLGIRLLFVSHI